jgi:hypothetical protein
LCAAWLIATDTRCLVSEQTMYHLNEVPFGANDFPHNLDILGAWGILGPLGPLGALGLLGPLVRPAQQQQQQ